MSRERRNKEKLVFIRTVSLKRIINHHPKSKGVEKIECNYNPIPDYLLPDFLWTARGTKGKNLILKKRLRFFLRQNDKPNGFVALWLCGFVALWLCGFVALWLCGFVALWLCGFVALWLCGFVALWLCGFVALWLCGFVALWLMQN